MDITAKTAIFLGKNTYSAFSTIYNNRQEKRIREFLNFVDIRYDKMTAELQCELNEYVNSELGQDILLDYVDSVLKTPSRRARMVTALLFCADADFSFSENEIRIFIFAMNGMTDELLDFFIKISSVETTETNYAYPRGAINSTNITEVFSHDMGVETIFMNIPELIRLNILLPDPQSNSIISGDVGTWSICFGITPLTKKLVAVILKATELIET